MSSNDIIVKNIRGRLEGLPIRVNRLSDDMIYIYTHADLFTNLEQYNTNNRWDHICLKINGTQFSVRNVTVAYYIDCSTFNESALVCHLFLKCIDRLGLSLSVSSIDEWAYVSGRYVYQPINKNLLHKITLEYINFLKICEKNYKWKSTKRWINKWILLVKKRHTIIQQHVWNHWIERALRPGEGSLFKLYEKRFYNLSKSITII